MSYSLYRRIRGTIDGPRSLEGSPEDARVPLLAHRGDEQTLFIISGTANGADAEARKVAGGKG